MRIPFTKSYACSGKRKHNEDCLKRWEKDKQKGKEWRCNAHPFYWVITKDYKGSYMLANSAGTGYLANYITLT